MESDLSEYFVVTQHCFDPIFSLKVFMFHFDFNSLTT